MKTNVGELRQQSALQGADHPVIAIPGRDSELAKLLGGRRLKVLKFYPDTTNGEGQWENTFKIVVDLVD